jgi:hypothetical protein
MLSLKRSPATTDVNLSDTGSIPPSNDAATPHLPDHQLRPTSRRMNGNSRRTTPTTPLPTSKFSTDGPSTTLQKSSTRADRARPAGVASGLRPSRSSAKEVVDAHSKSPSRGEKRGQALPAGAAAVLSAVSGQAVPSATTISRPPSPNTQRLSGFHRLSQAVDDKPPTIGNLSFETSSTTSTPSTETTNSNVGVHHSLQNHIVSNMEGFDLRLGDNYSTAS